MKRILLMSVMLVALLLGACGAPATTPTPTPRPTPSPVSTYFLQGLPLMERHRETVEVVSKAIDTLNSEAGKPSRGDPSRTQSEAIDTPRSYPISMSELTIEEIRELLMTRPKPSIPDGLREALTTTVNTLEWGLRRVDSEIVDYGKLIPPPEAQHFHDLLVSYLRTERAVWDNLLSYNSSILSKGHGDEGELKWANMLSLQARILWLEASLALNELDPRLRLK